MLAFLQNFYMDTSKDLKQKNEITWFNTLFSLTSMLNKNLKNTIIGIVVSD